MVTETDRNKARSAVVSVYHALDCVTIPFSFLHAFADAAVDAVSTDAEPVTGRNDEAGYVEFLNEDVPYIVRDIEGRCAILVDLHTRKYIGYRVYDLDSDFGSYAANAEPVKTAPAVAVKALVTEEMVAKAVEAMSSRDITFKYCDKNWQKYAIRHAIEAALSAQVQDVAESHPDDLAVDRFALAMKAKLAQKRAEGRGGWDNPNECSVEWLSELLKRHVEKGDPTDVGNFAMMIHQRGGRIAR